MYKFEPSNIEVKFTKVMTATIAKKYYMSFLNNITIQENDSILDYCCGSGIVSKLVTNKFKYNKLVYIDVSNKWLKATNKRVKSYNNVKGKVIKSFSELVDENKFDVILVHFVIHDFPEEVREDVIKHIIMNLKEGGTLYIREPIGEDHGVNGEELVNLFKSISKGRLNIEYKITNTNIDMVCNIVKS